jgi:hypothetical protein
MPVVETPPAPTPLPSPEPTPEPVVVSVAAPVQPPSAGTDALPSTGGTLQSAGILWLGLACMALGCLLGALGGVLAVVREGYQDLC